MQFKSVVWNSGGPELTSPFQHRAQGSRSSGQTRTTDLLSLWSGGCHTCTHTQNSEHLWLMQGLYPLSPTLNDGLRPEPTGI